MGFTELSNNANQYLNVNADLAILDVRVDGTVKSITTTAPPSSPSDGDAYVVPSGATGVWATHATQIAYWRTSAGAWKYIVPRAGWTARVEDDVDGNSIPRVYGFTGSVWSVPEGAGAVTTVNGATGAVIVPIPIIIACSDETTAITADPGKVTFRMPHAFTLTAVRASLTTAQSSGSIFTVDINEGGASILSTKLTIDNTEKTSTTAATPPVISDSSLADDAEITIDVDQVGDGTAKGLKVTLIGYMPL